MWWQGQQKAKAEQEAAAAAPAASPTVIEAVAVPEDTEDLKTAKGQDVDRIPGTEFEKGDGAAVVESVKAASDVYMPLDGEIVEINEALTDEPGKVNEDPMESAWFFKMKAADPGQMDDYMDEAAYKKLIG